MFGSIKLFRKSKWELFNFNLLLKRFIELFVVILIGIDSFQNV